MLPVALPSAADRWPSAQHAVQQDEIVVERADGCDFLAAATLGDSLLEKASTLSKHILRDDWNRPCEMPPKELHETPHRQRADAPVIVRDGVTICLAPNAEPAGTCSATCECTSARK